MTQIPHIAVRDLTMAYGSLVIQRDLSFDIQRGDIFVIMGGSGCGKSTLLKHLLGLIRPASGDILYDGTSFVHANDATREKMRQGWGITYQSGGLFSAMTLAENIVGRPRGLSSLLSRRAQRRHAQARSAGASDRAGPADPVF